MMSNDKMLLIIEQKTIEHQILIYYNLLKQYLCNRRYQQLGMHASTMDKHKK